MGPHKLYSEDGKVERRKVPQADGTAAVGPVKEDGDSPHSHDEGGAQRPSEERRG